MTEQNQLAKIVYSSLTKEDLIFIANHEMALMTGVLQLIGRDYPMFFYKDLSVENRLRPQSKEEN